MAYSGLSIPNEADAFHPSQAGLDAKEVQAVMAALQGTGVVSGCAVTAQGTPDTTVAVAAGAVMVGSVSAVVAAGNVTGFVAAAAGQARLDLVVADNAGAKSRLAGAEVLPGDATHAGPVWPAAFDPSTYCVLAEVYCDAASATVIANHITDKRPLLTGTYAPVSAVSSVTAGLLAARPAAATAGKLYLATDVGPAPGTLYEDNGTVWAPIGGVAELGSAEVTGVVTVTTNGTVQAITGLSITFATGARPAYLDLVIPDVMHSAIQSASGLGIFIEKGSGTYLAGSKVNIPTASRNQAVPLVRARIAANTASATYRATVYAPVNGTFTMTGDPIQPAIISAYQV